MATFPDKLRDAGQGDKSPSSASLTFLSDLGSEDRATLREMWGSFPVERRRRIARQLAEIAEDNINLNFRHVFLALLGDADAQVRMSAIEGLAEDESKLLLGRLLDLLQNDLDSDVRRAAASALGRFTYLAQCDKNGMGAELGKLRDSLMQQAGDEREETDVRRRAIESLGYLNGDAEVQELIAKSYKRGGKQAESAVFAMGRSMDSRWEPTILDELESDIPAMRYEAARAAGEMELEDALPLLIKMVDDPDTEVKLAAIWALGQIGGKPAAEALARVLQSDSQAIRDAAQEALQEIAFSANPLNVI
jgi:HEAT repeat protein